MKANIKSIGLSVLIAALLTACQKEGQAQQEDLSPQLTASVTPEDLEIQCHKIASLWSGKKTVPETLSWLEETMEQYGAQYAFQHPITKGKIIYRYIYKGTDEGALTESDLDEVYFFYS